MSPILSTNLDDPSSVPYFLWDEPMTVRELQERLRTSSSSEHFRILGKILREARDTDVWRFTTPRDVAANWDKLLLHLGRRRSFWQYLLERWRQLGLLDG